MRFRFNFIYFVFLLGVVFFIPLTKKLVSQPEQFYGIAENQIRSVNLQYPVEIKEINVALGQKVDSGQLLARLYRTDLPIKLNDINFDIREVQVKRLLDTEQLQSEVRKLEAERASISKEYDHKIAQLEAEYAVQNALLANIKSIDISAGKDNKTTPPYLLLIQSLKQEQAAEIHRLDVEIAELRTQMKAAQAPDDLRIKKLEGELELIKKQEAELELFSPQSGIVGQLDFLPGEKVTAYTIIMKIYGTHPDVVTTYIGDGRLAEIKLGDTLMVSSINDPAYQVAGVVLGLGTRIRELPERLRRMPELKAWGREVQLQIPLHNRFLQGEKVKVAMKPGKAFSFF